MHKFLLKFSIVLLVCLLFSIVLIFGINSYVKMTTANRIYEPNMAPEIMYDAAVVLGCGVYNNSVPSPLLKERLNAAIALYETGLVPKLIMSGDHGQKEYDEVNVMKKYAIEHGISSEDIFMDHAGFSTYESIYRAKNIFGAKNIVVVTQQYHLYRALYIAKALGIEAHGVKADQHMIKGQTARDLREILARNKDFVYSIFKPKASFEGSPIDLKGNGDLTND